MASTDNKDEELKQTRCMYYQADVRGKRGQNF